MKIFSDETIAEACERVNIPDMGEATIGDMVQLALDLERNTGVKFIRMDQGSPSLQANRIGIEAEKRALDEGIASAYPPAGGYPELKEAASQFIRAFIDIDIAPECIIPVTGAVEGAFASFATCAHRIPGKDKILVINPGFPVNVSQLRILGLQWRDFDIYSHRGPENFGRILEEHLSQGDIAGIIYSNPNNPAWTCLDESELEVLGRLATKYDAVAIEDLAYFCMDFRTPYGRPFEPPFLPSVTKYTDNYIVLMSASKIFNYAGQRMGLAAISPALYGRKYEGLAEYYGGSGSLGTTFTTSVIFMLTTGCTASTQMAYAEMLRRSCTGEINFVEDVREYERRARKVKEIFTSHGFHIVYDKDIERKIGDGFFFTLGYGAMSCAELVKELFAYGVSSITLSTTGSRQQGIRACVSRLDESQYGLLDERMAQFEADHPIGGHSIEMNSNKN